MGNKYNHTRNKKKTSEDNKEAEVEAVLLSVRLMLLNASRLIPSNLIIPDVVRQNVQYCPSRKGKKCDPQITCPLFYTNCCVHSCPHMTFILYTETSTIHSNKVIQSVCLILSDQDLIIWFQGLTELLGYAGASQIKRYNQVQTDMAEWLVLLSICYTPLHAGSHRKLLCLRYISAAQHTAASSVYASLLEQKSIQYHFRRAVLTCHANMNLLTL